MGKGGEDCKNSFDLKLNFGWLKKNQEIWKFSSSQQVWKFEIQFGSEIVKFSYFWKKTHEMQKLLKKIDMSRYE